MHECFSGSKGGSLNNSEIVTLTQVVRIRWWSKRPDLKDSRGTLAKWGEIRAHGTQLHRCIDRDGLGLFFAEMHITPGPPSMTIAKVRELAGEMAHAPSPVVLSFTQEQITDLLAEIELRTRPAPAQAPAPPTPGLEISPVKEFAAHRKVCEPCLRGPESRCATGQALYSAACAAVMDEVRLLV